MSLKRVEKEKILARHNKVAKSLFNHFKKKQKQPPEVFYKKAGLFKTLHYSQDGHESTCVRASF